MFVGNKPPSTPSRYSKSGQAVINEGQWNRDLAKADITCRYVAIGINPNPIDRVDRDVRYTTIRCVVTPMLLLPLFTNKVYMVERF